MINIKNKIAVGGLMLAGILATSCNDDNYDFADTTDQKATVTTNQTTYSGMEGDTIYMEFQLNHGVNRPADFKFQVQDASTASVDKFSVGDGPLVADYGNPEDFMYTADAFVESFTVPVYLNRNLSANEGSKDIKLKMLPTGSRLALTKEGGIDITINIEDEVSNELVMNLAWGEDYVGTDGEMHSFCDYDLDLELVNPSNNVVATSYTDCPEEINIFEGNLPDGVYGIQTSYYSYNESVAPTEYESIPAKLTIAKRGVFVETIDLSGIWTDFAGGADPDADGNIDNPEAYIVPASVEIAGTTYTVTNANGNVIAQGKFNTSKNNSLNQ